MRRTLLGLLTTLAIVGGSALVAAPAEAATKPVRITNSTNAWVGWNGKATVTPKFKKAKRVTIKKKVLTVKQGGKVIAKNRKKVTLRPGTYRVVVKVTYKYKGKTRTTAKSLKVTAKQGKCATAADYKTLVTDPAYLPEVVGDTVAQVSKKLRSTGSGETYTPQELREMLEAFKTLYGPLVPGLTEEIDKALAELDALEAKGVTILEDREYQGCGGDISIYTSFANGELMYSDNDTLDSSVGLLSTGGAALESLAR